MAKKPQVIKTPNNYLPGRSPEEREEQKAKLIEALDHLFTTGGWEIPDACVEGKLMAKVTSMEAQIKSLTQRVLDMQRAAEGKPGNGRVDAVAAMKKKP